MYIFVFFDSYSQILLVLIPHLNILVYLKDCDIIKDAKDYIAQSLPHFLSAQTMRRDLSSIKHHLGTEQGLVLSLLCSNIFFPLGLSVIGLTESSLLLGAISSPFGEEL